MNILFLDQYGDVGGAQACLLDLIPAVRDRGWIAHAAVPRHGPLGDRLRAQGVTVHDIPCGPYRSGSKSLADTSRFAVDVMQQRQVIQNLLREIAFDLVYVNGARLLPAASLAIPQHIPMVFHVHWRYAGTAARMTRWSIRRSHPSVIGCCRYVVQDLRVENLHVIPNGVADCGFREPAPCDFGNFPAASSLRISLIWPT